MTQAATRSLFDSLVFDNRFLRELPADPEPDNYRRQVYQACYSFVNPTPVPQPRLVAHSEELAAELGFSPDMCASDEFCAIFAGNRLLPGMQGYACCYGGHQFGHWAGQLGDGRVVNLGELVNKDGAYYTLQLKGAGLTPYSRSADGLAVLRSSIREFICSEAMHHLGVPTTRALTVIGSGQPVRRDMFYDGNPEWEPGAIVCRVAPSFTRFGSFQIFTARNDAATLKQLVDYTIRRDFPHLGEPGPETYRAWFEEVCRKTAELIVHWQRVGFVHGVMNTDNMSILGLTIDFGPYGWLENYDPNWTPNTTDAQGRRYRYGHQPKIAYWNLVQLANALLPIIPSVESLQQALDTCYGEAFDQGWRKMMASKLGLREYLEQSDTSLLDDTLMIDDLSQLLQNCETDMTLFYRGLADISPHTPAADFLAWFSACCYLNLSVAQRHSAKVWLQRYQQRLRHDPLTLEARKTLMHSVNPLYTPRNYLAQLVIDEAASGDFGMLREWLRVLRHPYTEQPGRERFAAKRPDWAKHRAGCSMLSCSS